MYKNRLQSGNWIQCDLVIIKKNPANKMPDFFYGEWGVFL